MWKVILGPPGTGKTSRCIELLQQELDQGTSPERIAYVSFTRAAIEEVAIKLGESGMSKADFQWFKTIHATAYKLLDLDDSKMMTREMWDFFASENGYKFSNVDIVIEEGIKSAQLRTEDDRNRALFDWGRNRALTVEETLSKTPLPVSAASFRKYAERCVAFKRKYEAYDFSDMLELVIERDLRPPVEVAFIDEAQDLSPLQYKAAEHLFGRCARVYVAGDDDQAIYGFQGADPEWFRGLAQRSTTEQRPVSHRVPRAPHALGQRIIGPNQHRLPKEYLPRDAEGTVERLSLESALKSLDPTVDTKILVRNRCFMQRVADQLLTHGIPFLVDGRGATNPLDEERGLLPALRAAEHLARGAPVSAQDLAKLLAKVPTRGDDMVPHGAKAKIDGLKGVIPFEAVQSLLRGGRLLSVIQGGTPVHEFTRFSRSDIEFAERVRRKHGDFFEPKVRLMTVHGAKGLQADTVVVLPDMTAATFRESLDVRHGGAEAENRLAYVAVTRTKNRLILVLPETKNYYPYPR